MSEDRGGRDFEMLGQGFRPRRGPGITKEDLVAVEDRLRIRISEMEMQNRRLKRLTMLLAAGLLVPLILVGVLFYMTPTLGLNRGANQAVEGRSFVLKDESGVTRGEWGVMEDGSARLSLKDRSGVSRLNMSVVDNGSPGLSFANTQGERRVVLALLPDETGTLVFADREGVPRAVVGLSRDESATLVFADAAGETRIGLSVEPGGAGSALLPEEMPTRRPARPQTRPSGPVGPAPGELTQPPGN